MFDLRSSFNDSDEDGARTEAPAESEALAKTIERIYMIRMVTLSMPNLLLKITLKILLKLNPALNLILKPKIVSTPELSLNVKNVKQNL